MSKTVFDADTTLRINPTHRLQWEEAQDCHVLLYPEGMVKLNPSAAEILKRLDGAKTVAQLLADLNDAFPGVDLERDVYAFLEIANDNGWIRID